MSSKYLRLFLIACVISCTTMIKLFISSNDTQTMRGYALLERFVLHLRNGGDKDTVLDYDSEFRATTPDDSASIPICSMDTMAVRRQVNEVNCAAIIEDGQEELNSLKIEEYMKMSQNITNLTDKKVATYSSSCPRLLSQYHLCAYSEKERSNPIAYSILCHKSAAQVEQLLRAIYQPQNVYCVHPDPKASPDFLNAINHIVACFPNVFIASKLESVVYASFSRLQAEINCFKDLMQRKEKWRYVINLTGQMFPLKTNREIVDILNIYNGSNDIHANNYFMSFRVDHKYKVDHGELVKTHEAKTDPIPGNLTLVKGMAYGTFSRAFIEFATTDKTAIALLDWSRDTKTPDEHFWATLNHIHANPGLQTPGGYTGVPHNKPYLSTYISWQEHHAPCHGMRIRSCCVFGLADLPFLVRQKHLFVNKLYNNYQIPALNCLAEWHHNRTLNRPYFNTSYYEQLPFANNIHAVRGGDSR